MRRYKKIDYYIFKGDLIAISYNTGDFKIVKDKKRYAKIKRV